MKEDLKIQRMVIEDLSGEIWRDILGKEIIMGNEDARVLGHLMFKKYNKSN